MLALASFVCGLLFGFGLFVSGMTQPAKVLGFLGRVRNMGSDLGICDGRCPSGFIRWVSRCPAENQAGASRREPLAEPHGYRPTPPNWISLIWGRVGLGWALPGTGPREPRDSDAASGRIRTFHGSRSGGQGPVGQVPGRRRNESAFHCERRLIPNTRDSKVLSLDRVICEIFPKRIWLSFQCTIWIPVALPCGASVTPT